MRRASGPRARSSRICSSSRDLDPAEMLSRFAERDYPLVEITPGDTYLDDHRRHMTLAQFREALDTQRRRVLAYVDGLDERELDRKARIPLFNNSWALMR